MPGGFIVRPFGRRKVGNANKRAFELDFDRVESELIRPAFERVGISGGTTGEIARTGNIRTDMFELLAVSDVVIADITIHNANVFYELGVRHALRTKITVLIRCRGDDIPFDLRTDRYLEYDADAPGDAVNALVKTLTDSLAESDRDSPIFALLPKLAPPSITTLSPIPIEFQEAVRRAAQTKDIGQLVLLGEELDGQAWAAEGIRLVSRELFIQKHWTEALSALKRLRSLVAEDTEADLKLATVYQRMNQLGDSDNAIRRALSHHSLSSSEIAEAYSLMASNAKSHWLNDLGKAKLADVENLGFAHLIKATELYRKGFNSDLNHYYSGLNAFAMVTILLELGRLHQDWWNNNHDDDSEAKKALDDLEHEQETLRGAVDLSIRRAVKQQNGDAQLWACISRADFLFLSAPKDQDVRVLEAYRKALVNAPEFAVDAVSRQLNIYAKLGIFLQRVAVIQSGIKSLITQATETSPAIRWIVFAGHRVDAPRRAISRFPATDEAQSLARTAIETRLKELTARYPDTKFIGLCGAANGGDILFHEVCQSLAIPVWLYLAIPEKDYIEQSVRHEVQTDWVSRFCAVLENCRQRTHHLSDEVKLPVWLKNVSNDYIWERNNRWLLYSALAEGANKLHLLVLWDGKKEGDGAGGTHHMVQVAKSSGADIITINTRELFGLE